MFRVTIICLGALVVFTGHVAAASISINNITGAWTSVSGAPVNGIGSNTISWGSPISPGLPSSSYSFIPVSTPTGPHGIDSEFTLGTFKHVNYPIYPSSITSAILTLSVSGIVTGGPAFNLTSTFEFLHNETQNTSFWCCRDIVTAQTNPSNSTNLTLDGVTYLFAFGGFLVGDDPFQEFQTQEWQTNVAKIRGSFSVVDEPPVATPLPAALPLFASALGLGGLFGWARKRRLAS